MDRADRPCWDKERLSPDPMDNGIYHHGAGRQRGGSGDRDSGSAGKTRGNRETGAFAPVLESQGRRGLAACPDRGGGLAMYLEINGSMYLLLIEQEQGGWLIPYETPGAPIFLTRGEWGKRVAVPAEPDCPKTKAEQERLDMIHPLIEERACITDKTLRRRMAIQIAEKHHTKTGAAAVLYFSGPRDHTAEAKSPETETGRAEEDICGGD